MYLLRKISYLMLITGLFLCTKSELNAQEGPASNKLPMPVLGPNDTIPVPAQAHDGQIIPVGNLEWIYVSAKYPKHLLKKRQEWTRLRNAVYVTYPYARKAAYIINDINAKLASIPNKGERKRYIKSREKDLKKEFGDPIKNLSVYQGKVLMKLINRQTGNNCYEILKEYKGGFNARMFQTVAFVFGSNLKQDYNAAEADREIERFVNEYESTYGWRR
jgi:hypothetical protein